MAKTYSEGASKYGELNYLINTPDSAFVKDVYNHVDEHLQRAKTYLFNVQSPLREALLQEEPNFDVYLELAHAAWGLATLMVYHQLGHTDAAKAEIEEATNPVADPELIPDYIDDDRDVVAQLELDLQRDASIAETSTLAPIALTTPAQPPSEHPAITRAKQLFGLIPGPPDPPRPPKDHPVA